MAVTSTSVPLETQAPGFTLDSVTGEKVSLADLTGPALLVVFLSNHCPYVKHLESALGKVAAEYAERGLVTVGIASNDVTISPDDGTAGLTAQVNRAGFTFPYLMDSTQQVARAYDAACTPDFFLFGAQRRLAYRGAFDTSRPGNDTPVTGELLRAAIDHVLNGEPVAEPHQPSTGCSIKWRPDNTPEPTIDLR